MRHIRPLGAIVSIGTAAGAELQTSGYPCIPRGVSLLGPSATHCPMEVRRRIWTGLGGAEKPSHIDLVAGRIVGLTQVIAATEDVLELPPLSPACPG